MTALYEDTAQLPTAPRAGVITLAPVPPPIEVETPERVVVAPPDAAVSTPVPSACRAELRAERLRARRLRRRWVGISFFVMGSTLGATVAVLEFLH